MPRKMQVINNIQMISNRIGPKLRYYELEYKTIQELEILQNKLMQDLKKTQYNKY